LEATLVPEISRSQTMSLMYGQNQTVLGLHMKIATGVRAIIHEWSAVL